MLVILACSTASAKSYHGLRMSSQEVPRLRWYRNLEIPPSFSGLPVTINPTQVPKLPDHKPFSLALRPIALPIGTSSKSAGFARTSRPLCSRSLLPPFFTGLEQYLVEYSL